MIVYDDGVGYLGSVGFRLDGAYTMIAPAL